MKMLMIEVLRGYEGKISKILVVCLITFFIIVFGFLLFHVRPQSDDLGFTNHIRYHGLLGFYAQMRLSVDAGIYMLFFGLPLFSISEFINSKIIIICLYILLAYSVFRVLKAFFQYYTNTKPLRYELIIFSIFVVLSLIFTSWNRHTFQNAIFWFTGVVVYIGSIVFVLLAMEAVIKRNPWGIVPLLIIVSNTRINYLLILIILMTPFFLEDWKNRKLKGPFWINTIFSGLIGTIYLLLAPGLQKRLDGEADSVSAIPSDFLLKAIEAFSAFFTETSYLLFFSALFLLITKAFPRLALATKLKMGDMLKLAILVFFILFIHNALLVLIFKNDFGYGRVYVMAQLVFILFWYILIRNTIYVFLFENKRFGTAVFLFVLVAGSFSYLLYDKIRMDIYQAMRFSSEYDERYGLINRYKDNAEIRCMIFNKFSDSGIIGFHDIPIIEKFDCNYIRKESWNYGEIEDYDQWVFEKYYKTPFRIVTVERNISLPMKENFISFDLKE